MTRLAVSLTEKIYALVDQERERLFLWTPILFAIGIYLGDLYQTKFDFDQMRGLLVGALLVTFLCYGKLGFIGRKLVVIPLIILSGIVTILWSINSNPTKILSEKIEPVRIIGDVDLIERFPNKTRLTLSNISATSGGKSYGTELNRVRLTFRGRLRPALELALGSRISVLGSLSPPGKPIAPGAYNFERHAFYDHLSAVGFAFTPPEVLSTDQVSTVQKNLSRLRHKMTERFKKIIPKEAGSIAAALVTGDRSGIPENLKKAYADAGIAHILAISGLHLSLVAGLMFLLIRGGLSLIPAIALRFNTKKIAAGFALILTACYLLISGMTIPAQRAFIMTSIILLAVILDREAFTLRNVALAALVILIIKPYALFTASFQLSFAAVTGLIAFYDSYQEHVKFERKKDQNLIIKFLRYLWALTLTSLIATLATAPITVFIFNRFSLAALLANLLVIPLVSFILMPLLLVTTLLLSVDFVTTLLSPVIKLTLDLISQIALYFSQSGLWVVPVANFSLWSELLIVFGLLWLALWKTKMRYVGLGVILCAAGIEAMTPRPDIYLGPKNKLVMIRRDPKTWITNTRVHERFARESWGTLQGSPRIKVWHQSAKIPSDQYYVTHKKDVLLTIQDLKIFATKEGRLTIKNQQDEVLFDSIQAAKPPRPYVFYVKGNQLKME